jgi:sporulation protein YlmC with PRC-barrel domain
MQQAMLQPGDQTPESGQADQQAADQEPATTGQPETAATEGSEQPGGAGAGDSPLAQMPASELLGQEVVNDQGDTVAEIVDMVKRPDSDEIFALLSVGGFLGLGEKEVAMPLDRFDVGEDQQIILSNATEEELTNMPDWEDDGMFESVSQ